MWEDNQAKSVIKARNMASAGWNEHAVYPGMRTTFDSDTKYSPQRQ